MEITKEKYEKDIQEAITRINEAEKQVRVSTDLIQRNWGIIEYCQEEIKKFATEKEEIKDVIPA